MRIIGWCVFAVLAAPSLSVIFINYQLFWRSMRAKPGERTPSMIPIVGGLFGSFAVRVLLALLFGPRHGWSWAVLLPAALDPGCYVVAIVLVPIARLLRRFGLMSLLALLACATAACASHKVLPEHGVPNFREVIPGVYRGGQPTSEGWAYLKEKGVKTVVRLHLDSEGSDEEAVKLGMTVVDASGPPSEIGDVFGAPKPERIRLAVETLRDEKLRPVFVHCLHGQDRTGLIVGFFRVLHDGFTKKAAYAEMRKHKFHPALRGLHEAWERFDGKTL